MHYNFCSLVPIPLYVIRGNMIFQTPIRFLPQVIFFSLKYLLSSYSWSDFFFSPKQLTQFKYLAGFSYFYWLGVQKQWTFLIPKGPDFVYYIYSPAFLLRKKPTLIWNHHLHVISCQHNHLKTIQNSKFFNLSFPKSHTFIFLITVNPTGWWCFHFVLF